MKKKYNIAIALVALLAFAPFMRAQDVPFPADPTIKFSQVEWNKEYTIKNQVGYRKIISKPNSQGIYHILLDAFVTGREIKTNTAVKADIVLVLDNSTSMRNSISGGSTRLQALKDAVGVFVDLIDQNDTENAPEGSSRLGNRIAIVPFGSEINTGNSGNDRVRNFTALSRADEIKSWVNGLTAPQNNGTNAHLGMEKALDLVKNYSSAQIKTVVLFTDGDPGYYGDWTSRGRIGTYQYPYGNPGETYAYQNTWNSANSTINYAGQIKELAVDDPDPSKKRIVNVFTVSVIPSAGDYTKVYLGKTSSNWDKTTSQMGSIRVNSSGNVSGWESDIWTNGNGNRNTYINDQGQVVDETKFAITASNASQLIQAFETIAESTGGSSEALGESSVATVDIVSASFILPPGANENSIKVYSSRCVEVPAGSDQPVFGADTLAPLRKDKYQPMKKEGQILVPDGEPKDVDNAITVALKTSVLSGKKDSITVHGFDYSNNWCGEVVENGIHKGWHGNKVTILIPIKMNPEALGGVGVDTNGEGSGIYIDGKNEFPFTSPKVNLPVNIIINKQGLDEGESSKFTILRKTATDSNWEEVTSVFVTRHKGQDINAPRTRIEGLPATNKSGAEYIYKVREDDWSWSYTLTSDRELTTEDNDNPFTFRNRKKYRIDTKIRHAESKATNTFKTGGGAAYDDSKSNGRTVITVEAETEGEGGGTTNP